MKLIFAFFLSFLSALTVSSFCQNATIDSLRNLLENSDQEQKLSVLKALAYSNNVAAEERIEFSNHAIELALKIHDTESEAYSRLCLGAAYGNASNYPKALEALHQSLDLYEEINDIEGQSKVMSVLGRSYFFMTDIDKALEYLEHALALQIEMADFVEIAKGHQNLGNIYASLGKFEDAMTSFKKALVIKMENGDLKGCSQCYNNIANIHFAKGEMAEVLPYRLKALEIDRELNDAWQVAIKAYNLAEYYLAVNEPDKALDLILESKEISESLDNKELVIDNIQFLSWYYELKSDWERAFKYQKEYADRNGDLFSERLSKEVGELQVLYDTEKTEKKKKAVEIKLIKTKEKQLYLVFSLVLFLLVILLLYLRYSRSRRYSKLLKYEVEIQTDSLLVKNQELEASMIRAEESDRLKSSFLANMSHEIRTPMNGIVGFISLLGEDDVDPEDREKYLSIINKNSERLLRTINNVIDVAKIESGDLDDSILEVDVNEILTDHYNLFLPEGSAKGLEFKLVSAPQPGELILLLDKNKVETVLTNLLNNAIKFTDKGFVEFGLTEESNSGLVTFYVRDSGRGISVEEFDQIFKRFVKSEDNLTKSHEGSGLGLSISKAYVTRMQGKIWLESTEGKGSTFFFSIPLSCVE